MKKDKMVFKTRLGTPMQPHILAKLEPVLLNPAHDFKTRDEVATLAGVHKSTVTRYLTPQLQAYIQEKRQAALAAADMKQLDKALFERALTGDIAAAKVLYARWDKQQATLNDMLTLDDGALLEVLDGVG